MTMLDNDGVDLSGDTSDFTVEEILEIYGMPTELALEFGAYRSSIIIL